MDVELNTNVAFGTHSLLDKLDLTLVTPSGLLALREFSRQLLFRGYHTLA
jgi:hypothetical protein